ncbi:MAG: helix-hairpin-helix domain-containing protein [bacterium]
MSLIFLLLLFGLSRLSATPLEDYLEGDTQTAERAAAVEEQVAMPMNLNAASPAELSSLPWLSSSSIAAILRERSRLGGFRDFSQLEAIAGLSRDELELLRQVAVIGDAYARPFFGYARASAGVRCPGTQPLLTEDIYGESRSRFRSLSGANGFVLAQHPSYSPVLSHFTSVGLEFRWPSARVLFGDYQAEFGTGLVFSSPWGQAGWTRDALRVAPPEPRGLRSVPTASPLGFLRGAALNAAWRPFELSFLISSLELSAATENGVPTQILTGSVSAGELSSARAGQIREETAGFSISVSRQSATLGVNGLWSRFRPRLSPAPSPAAPEPLAGNSLRVGSLYFSIVRNGIAFVGEFAGSSPRGEAYQSALSLFNGPLGFAFFASHADADFHSPRSRAWDEFDAPAQNTHVLGSLVRLELKNHLLTLRAASSATPFRTPTSSLSRTSGDLDARWRAALRNLTLEVRGERSYREAGGEEGLSYPVQITGGRLDIAIRSILEMRLRTQIRRAISPSEHGVGTLSFVQVGQRRPLWQWLARLTVFHVSDENAALTVYENHLPGSYPLVSFFGDGSRKMMLVSRRLGHFQAGAKASRTDKTTKGERSSDWHFALFGELTW